MIVSEIKDDVLKVVERFIEITPVILLHGCNCFHTMGAGIAFHLKNNYPQVYEADLATPYGDKSKLGTFSYCVINDKLTIVNCYTQYRYGMEKQQIDLKAVSDCITSVCNFFDKGYIVLPRIGAGLGGGNWNEIKEVINTALKDRLAAVCYL
jgi:O-acetyl-ADP-ribose deacetylase (regulator of RNase III)